MWTNTEQTAYAYTGGKSFSLDVPCVVMLHGAQNDHSVWALQSRWLAHHGFSVLAFDLPAHGLSAGPALASVSDMARWVREQLDNIGVPKAHIIGHSMGSLIALELAGIAPERVSSLSLLGTAVPMPVGQTLRDATQLAPTQAMHQINAWSHRASVAGYRSANPGFSHIGTSAALMARMAQRHGTDVLSTDFAACNAYDAGLARAGLITVKTLIMNGENDAMTPAKSAQQLARLITQSTLVLIPQCGHALMSEQPDIVLNQLRAHLNPH